MSTITPTSYLPPLNQEAASKLNEDIDVLLDQISAHELRLASSYARLGSKLREVKLTQSWMARGCDRFSTYLQYVCNRIGRQRSQVYNILTVSEVLSPHLSEEVLEEIGIAKAYELRRFVKQGGSLTAEVCLPSEVGDEFVRLMDYAARPKVTAAMLHVKVNEILHVKEGPKGNWYEFGGGYLTADERKEVEQFWALGKQMLDVEDETPEHVWKKEVFLSAVRESVGTWSAEVGL